MRGSSVAGYAREGAAAHRGAGFGLGSTVWSGVRHDRERAYQAVADSLPVSLASVYNKLSSGWAALLIPSFR